MKKTKLFCSISSNSETYSSFTLNNLDNTLCTYLLINANSSFLSKNKSNQFKILVTIDIDDHIKPWTEDIKSKNLHGINLNIKQFSNTIVKQIKVNASFSFFMSLSYFIINLFSYFRQSNQL